MAVVLRCTDVAVVLGMVVEVQSVQCRLDVVLAVVVEEPAVGMVLAGVARNVRCKLDEEPPEAVEVLVEGMELEEVVVTQNAQRKELDEALAEVVVVQELVAGTVPEVVVVLALEPQQELAGKLLTVLRMEPQPAVAEELL